jgi:mycothiol synthase
MEDRLPEGYRYRPPTLQDVGATVEMLNSCSKQLIGVEEYTGPQFDREWRTPGYNLETDARLVIAPDGRVVAFYEVWDPGDPHTLVFIWGRVHPEHVGRGIGSFLLSWAEGRACQAIAKTPQEAHVVLRAHVMSIDEAAQQLFRDSGFELIRHSWRMVINLNGSPPVPEWPEGITLRHLVVGQDERAVFQAVDESFKDHWGHLERPFEEEFARWKHSLESTEDFDPSLIFLAMDGDEIAGVSLCLPKIIEDPQMGWVRTLCVRRPWRRRGLGMALLLHSFREFHNRGKSRVGLGVDAQNLTGATGLYFKAGMHPDPARQYSLYEKELRSGRDISIHTVQD